MRSVAFAALGAVVLGGGVVAWRTATFEAPASAQAVPLAPAVAVDAEAAARRLGESIRFQTVNNQNPADNRWEEWDKLHAWLETSYPAAHKAMTREIVGNRTLVYSWPGSDPKLEPIILMAHQDVVPITAGSEKDWKHAPFGGELADGYVWGRGAVDDKGSLIALFEAMETLAAQGYAPKRTIYLVSGADEETRAGGAKVAADLLKQRGVKAWFVLDEGFSGTTKDPLTGKAVARILVAEKGYATLRVTAEAEGGHSSAPPRETAVVSLAKAVTRIAERPYPTRIDGAVSQGYQALVPQASFQDRVMLANLWLFEPFMARKLEKSPAAAATLHTTIAPTMLEGAPKENVLPQKAIARINFRLAPGDTSDKVMARSKAAVADLPVELSWEKPPFEATAVSSTTSDPWKILSTLVADTSGATVAPGLMRAGTDSWFFRPIATDTYLFTPVILSPEEEKMVHGTNERVSVKALGEMVTFYSRLIRTAAG
ncbi:M20 family peptidase [Caulobacter sp. 17J65-9]|uniref:M20 family peptidase n=1 Tax=Caulobacter sp. 17J65-9 TaxID=2709382 RepID=UPI0013CA3C60|nr:M20 family peptidase [Caulobacter sp. 17J65-9]NEX93405.1 M20 family peptidase [Caulobacter sp. 17J65-9]